MILHSHGNKQYSWLPVLVCTETRDITEQCLGRISWAAKIISSAKSSGGIECITRDHREFLPVFDNDLAPILIDWVINRIQGSVHKMNQIWLFLNVRWNCSLKHAA